MENEDSAHLESHYQNELEFMKNKVTRMNNLLKQLLRSKNGEGMSVQPLVGAWHDQRVDVLSQVQECQSNK
jgi:homospermidine synthase